MATSAKILFMVVVEASGSDSGSPAGRVAVVTGVSRRAGIGFAIVREFVSAGFSVMIQSWTAHDAEQPWGADPAGIAGVLEALGGTGHGVEHVEADFLDPATPAWVIEQARQRFGHVDVLVANHARSSKQTLA